MRIASIAVLLVLVPIAWGQARCNIKNDNQDPSNAAYVQSTPTVGPDGLTQCEMKLCSGGTLPLTGINAMPVNSSVKLVINQYCEGFNSTILGCAPDSWVQQTSQDTTWYYQGCPHCSANTCDVANANSITNAMIRNQFHTRYVELPFAGRTCYQLKCIETQCLNDSRQKSDWAYVRTSSPGSEQFWFPKPGDPFAVVQQSQWSEFDLPNSYACPNTFPQQSPHLCDVANVGSYWTGSYRFNYVNNTQTCEIRKCAGTNGWPLFATATKTSFSNGNVKPAFVTWIRKTCPAQIQGCYSDVTQWQWDHVYQDATTPSGNCAPSTAFCSRLYCACSSPDRYQYSIDTIDSAFPTLTGSATGGTWGYVVPSQRQKCIKAGCQANRRLSSVNNTVVETIYNGNIAVCAAPTVEYYTGSSNIPQGVTIHQAIPMAYRKSSTYTAATYGRTTQLLCSALGNAFTAGGQIDVTATNPPTCYRSPFYTMKSITANNALSTFYGFSSTSDCNPLSSTNYPWNQASGAGCPVSSPTTMPTSTCKSNLIIPTTGCYQQAEVGTLDKRYIEFQCYPSRENIKLKTQCTTISSTRLQDLYDDTYLAECYADRPAAFNYLRARTCLSSSNTYMSPQLPPNDESDMRMQNNECDWFRFVQVYEKIATCECQNVERINRGGLPAYQWQMQKEFRTNFRDRIVAYSLRTLLDDLQTLGCTYSFACAASGTATVMVKRPKFEAYYIVPTACKNVDWATLKSNIEAVTARSDIGGTTTSVLSGRFGGVQMKTQDAVDLGVNKCRVRWWTYFVDPDKARWFDGNLTAATGSPALPKSTADGPGVVRISFTEHSASSASTAPTAPGARHVPSVVLVLFSCVVYMLR